MEKDTIMKMFDKMFKDISEEIKNDNKAPKELKATALLAIDIKDKTGELMEYIKGSDFHHENDELYDGIIYHCNNIIELIDEILEKDEDGTTVLKFNPDNPF